MEIVLLKDHVGCKRGEVLEVSTKIGADLIKQGIAIERGAPQAVSVNGIPAETKMGIPEC